jgi:hypothetical protein
MTWWQLELIIVIYFSSIKLNGHFILCLLVKLMLVKLSMKTKQEHSPLPGGRPYGIAYGLFEGAGVYTARKNRSVRIGRERNLALRRPESALTP